MFRWFWVQLLDAINTNNNLDEGDYQPANTSAQKIYS